ncbi:hypothetical protein [Allorhodopirellula heiligendammensis]|uniref:Uncharacterized protein n=1 Tax=Allorhodopirellula heiligendammensis TaxID=2714739 RepID=A0A5C6BUK7_9BACT|nr:hypothetical protein [Allorhodopirellula heiligendammensis]TWU15950.1 hypothetical protein Poly21_31540 [Allorhodopirellula heiligendammensis]
MSALIGNIVFDLVDRPFELPKWSTAVFVQPGTQFTGVQMLPPTGRPFTRILTLIDAAFVLQANQDIQTSKVGFALPVTAFGVNYSLTYRRLFFVANVEILQAEILPHASGQKFGVPYIHTPASRVTSAWTFITVPRD